MNIMCGFGVQEMRQTEVITKVSSQLERNHAEFHYPERCSFQVYTQGCIRGVQGYVEQNMYVIAAIALGVALMQLLGERPE